MPSDYVAIKNLYEMWPVIGAIIVLLLPSFLTFLIIIEEQVHALISVKYLLDVAVQIHWNNIQ